ncbi:MAG: hypothetical protein RJB65_2011 [Actinomycetota bacterium]
MRSAAELSALAALADTGVVGRASSSPLASGRLIDVSEEVRPLLPRGGLQRGEVVSCEGVAAVSMAMAVVAGPSQSGSWVAWAGVPGVNAMALHQMGVALERTVWVGDDGSEGWSDAVWGDVLAALVDGVDVVVVGPGVCGLRPATARRLTARLQNRGAVLVAIDQPVFGADLRLETRRPVWHGLGRGHGLAQGRDVEIEVTGRRAARPARHPRQLPTAAGMLGPSDSERVESSRGLRSIAREAG